MAGNPLFRDFVELLNARFGSERDFMEWIAEGGRVREEAEAMGVSPAMFYKWINRDKDRKRLFGEARKLSAGVLVDEALEIADNSTPSRSAVDRERIKIRTWLAERYDRPAFGGAQTISDVTINIGDLHLEALKAADEPPLLPTPAPEVEEADFEVVEETEREREFKFFMGDEE